MMVSDPQTSLQQYNFATYFPWWDKWMGTAYAGPRKVYQPNQTESNKTKVGGSVTAADLAGESVTTGLVHDNDIAKLRLRANA